MFLPLMGTRFKTRFPPGVNVSIAVPLEIFYLSR
jgi:hypothetical protein